MIDDSCPNDLIPYDKMYEMRIKHEDEIAYLHGVYVLRAIGNAFNGKDCPYPDKPILSEEKAENERKNDMSEEDKRKQIETLFMQLEVMGGNFNRLHKNKADSN